MPASVAQSNGHLTGDQEVPGKIPAKNILSWRLIMKYFLLSFCPSADSRRAVSGKDCAQVLVYRLEVFHCPSKVWLG